MTPQDEINVGFNMDDEDAILLLPEMQYKARCDAIESKDSYVDAAATAAIVGGAASIYSGVQKRKEARIHRGALREIARSMDLSMAPQVIEFENETATLTGNVIAHIIPKEEMEYAIAASQSVWASRGEPDRCSRASPIISANSSTLNSASRMCCPGSFPAWFPAPASPSPSPWPTP